MRQYDVISSHVTFGGRVVEVGDVVELSDRDGNWMVGLGRVKPRLESPAPGAPPETVVEAPAALTPADSTTELETPLPTADTAAPRRRSGRT